MEIAVAGVAEVFLGKLGEWDDSIGGSIGECGVGNYLCYLREIKDGCCIFPDTFDPRNLLLYRGFSKCMIVIISLTFQYLIWSNDLEMCLQFQRNWVGS